MCNQGSKILEHHSDKASGKARPRAAIWLAYAKIPLLNLQRNCHQTLSPLPHWECMKSGDDSPVHGFGSGNWSDRYRLGIGRLFIEILSWKPWNISVNAPINVLPQVPPHGQRVGIWPIWNQLPLPPEQILWSNAVSMNFDQIPLIWGMFITPRACARGKVISFPCRLSA